MINNQIEEIAVNAIETNIGKMEVNEVITKLENQDNEFVYVPAGFKYKEIPFVSALSIIISFYIIIADIIIASKHIFSSSKRHILNIIIAIITGILSVICLKNSYREGHMEHLNCGCGISWTVESARLYMYLIVFINILLAILMSAMIIKAKRVKKEENKHEQENS